MKQPELGDSARDVITGFAGIVTCKAEYIFGCKKIQLTEPGPYKQPRNAATAISDDAHVKWFDEDSVAIVKAGTVRRAAHVIERAGGPVSNLPPIR